MGLVVTLPNHIPACRSEFTGTSCSDCFILFRLSQTFKILFASIVSFNFFMYSNNMKKFYLLRMDWNFPNFSKNCDTRILGKYEGILNPFPDLQIYEVILCIQRDHRISEKFVGCSFLLTYLARFCKDRLFCPGLLDSFHNNMI